MPLPLLPRRGAALVLGAALSLAPVAGLRGAEEADAAPPPPAEAPPEPVSLSPDGRPPADADAGSAAFEALTEGRWRIRFAAGRDELSESAAMRVGDLGRRLAEAGATGRVTVEAQASGPEADVSAARRLSLGRALAVKAALAGGGLAPTRIDLRPLGRTPEAVDAADILPPAAPTPRRAGGAR